MSAVWYGKLPERWDVVPNRVVFTERKTKNNNNDAQLLSLSQYSGISKKTDTAVGIRPAESLIGYSIVKKNDIVMNIMLAWNGSQAISPFNGVISPAYAVFSVRGDCNPWYYHYLMRTPEICNYFSAYSTGVIKSRLRLYPEIFRTLKTLLPPSDEQDQIVRFLDWKVSQINKFIKLIYGKPSIDPKVLESHPNSLLALLIEYRTRLISDTVTGKLDVRGVIVPEYVSVVEDSASDGDIIDNESMDDSAEDVE